MTAKACRVTLAAYAHPMGADNITATSGAYRGTLEAHLKRICEDAGATSARVIVATAQNQWIDHAASPGRDLLQDQVLVAILAESNMAPVTVNASREGTMIEHKEIGNDRRVILIASYDRQGTRAAGYVRHEIRRKLRQLCRELGKVTIDARQPSEHEHPTASQAT